MPTLNHISNIITALEKGKELDSVEEWKKSGVLTSLITSVFSLGAVIAVNQGWIQESIPPEVIMTISGIAVSVVTLFLGWVQVATTKKIGTNHSE